MNVTYREGDCLERDKCGGVLFSRQLGVTVCIPEL